eukprot:scaffold12434_cov37-Tisochrysis_lutea.AAC.1
MTQDESDGPSRLRVLRLDLCDLSELGYSPSCSRSSSSHCSNVCPSILSSVGMALSATPR